MQLLNKGFIFTLVLLIPVIGQDKKKDSTPLESKNEYSNSEHELSVFK